MTEVIRKNKSDARIQVLRNTIAKGATDAEFAMFLEIVKATRLNPFKREIWFYKSKGYTNKRGQWVEGQVQIMTGINGFLAIANNHPEFDGMETAIERNSEGALIRAVTKVYRKDRKYPSTGVAEMSEYYRPNFSEKKGVWDEKPSHMLAKVSKSIALREAFPQELSGLYTKEEMNEEEPKVNFEQSVTLAENKEAPITEEEVEEAIAVVVSEADADAELDVL